MFQLQVLVGGSLPLAPGSSSSLHRPPQVSHLGSPACCLFICRIHHGAANGFSAGGLLDRDEVNPVLNGTLPGDYGYDPLGLG